MNDIQEKRMEVSGPERTAGARTREPETRLDASKARAGETSGHMRILLVVSTCLAAAALLGAWWYYFG